MLSSPFFATLDFVIHLGDYFYEYTIDGPDSFPSAALGLAVPARIASFKASKDYPTLLGKVPTTVEEYRARYRLTRSDPATQAMHAAHAIICTWCDDQFYCF